MWESLAILRKLRYIYRYRYIVKYKTIFHLKKAENKPKTNSELKEILKIKWKYKISTIIETGEGKQIANIENKTHNITTDPTSIKKETINMKAVSGQKAERFFFF